METVRIKLSRLEPNTGQLPGLPTNPRQWTRQDVDRIARSLKETPELFEARPLLVYPLNTQETDEAKRKYIILGGNLRYEGAKANKMKDVPCIVFPWSTDFDTLKAIVIKDNGSFGAWDYDQLANEWGDLPLTDWGVPVWDPDDWQKEGLSSKGREGDDEYDAFVDKFQQKLTTDDCYTPPAVYDAVLDFVRTITDLTGKKIERPFVPGGDYENYPYTDRSVVVDNPPFSLLSKICRFYAEKGIPFFIFAPQLTLFTATDCDLTYIISDSDIEYENGAKVKTGFITNLVPDLRIWLCPQLRDALIEAQPDEDKAKQGFCYPDNIVTAATLGKVVKRSVELKIRKESCEYIHDSDAANAQGRSLFGGGFILSERAAAERAAAERAAATKLYLSEKERAIIARLGEQEAKLSTDTAEAPQTQN